MRHRVEAFAVDMTEPDLEEWTEKTSVIEQQVQHYRDECYDWIYIQCEGLGRVAFDGDSDLPSVREYLDSVTGLTGLTGVLHE